MPAIEFMQFLKEDHIENITVKKDPLKKLKREKYRRYIKALVQSGNVDNDTLYKTVSGQQFETFIAKSL